MLSMMSDFHIPRNETAELLRSGDVLSLTSMCLCLSTFKLFYSNLT